MLETCLGNKVIRDFLKHYKQSRWQKLIPSLIEIAILNLNSSFNTLFFSEEDIDNILSELKSSPNKTNKKEEPLFKNNHKVYYKPSNQWRTADGGVEQTKSKNIDNNEQKNKLYEMSNNMNQSLKNREVIDRENVLIYKNIRNTKSKIKDQVQKDKAQYLKKQYEDYPRQYEPVEKINYAISYDKNLQPETIEKATINNNKKGGKKIIQKMTQEEYEQQFPEEQQEEEYEYDDNNEQNLDDDDNEEQQYYENMQNNNNNYNVNYPINNNSKKNKKNLYHYKDENMQQNEMDNYPEENNEIIGNPQQSFNPQAFKNINDNDKQNNNYINIENNINDKNDYNFNENKNNEKDEKDIKYIGIDKKYKKKIDELEKNILPNNNTNHYANKLNVNIANDDMYNYQKVNNLNPNDNNNEEIEEEEEYQKYQYNNLNDENEQQLKMNDNMNEEHEVDEEVNEEDFLSQISNMTEKTKSLFKRTMDEYPPVDDDNFS